MEKKVNDFATIVSVFGVLFLSISLLMKGMVDYLRYKDLYKMSLNYCTRAIESGKNSKTKEVVDAVKELEPKLESLKKKIENLTFIDVFLSSDDIYDEVFDFERTVDEAIINSIKKAIENKN